jgi:molybdenum cofactor cytidylyltransferase
MRTPDQHAGVLLAAGRSRRMGTAKQLLGVPAPGGGSEPVPMVCASFDVIAPWCDGRVVVVLGHEADAVRTALGARRFVGVPTDPDADMMESVRAGLGAAIDRFPEAGAMWLHLVDVPFVRAGTLTAVSAAFEAHGGRVGVMPDHGGRGGHPALIPRAVAQEIMRWNGAGGLRAFWTEHPGLRLRLAVDDPGVVRDLDTPEAYREAMGGA